MHRRNFIKYLAGLAIFPFVQIPKPMKLHPTEITIDQSRKPHVVLHGNRMEERAVCIAARKAANEWMRETLDTSIFTVLTGG